ncbi:MAG: FtsX-like permease family protein [Chloroflexi bacterium]|nr:MAG: FtsX-like permease family protein [Chloroflexota bacterium]
MTDFGISSTYGRGPLASLIKALPMPLTLRQAANNVNQKKFRLALTGTTLTIAIGAFMGIYAVFSSLSSLIDDIFGTFGSQITISPTESQDFATVHELLQEVPGIKAADPSGSLAIEITDYEPPPVTAGPPGIFAIGIDPANPDIMNFDLQSGDAWNNDPSLDGVVLSSRIAAGINKEAGETVDVRVGGNYATLPILGVATYPFDTVWMRWDTLARLGGLTSGGPQPNSYFTTVAVSGYEGSLPDNQITVVGMDEHTGTFLTYVEGQGFTPGEPHVIISETMAENGGYQVGDTLTLTAANGSSADYTITGIVELPPQLPSGETMPQDVMAMFWRDLAEFEGRDLSGEPSPNSISIMMEDSDPTAKEANNLIDDINDVLLANGISAEYTNWVEFNDIITGFIIAFQVILYLAAGLIAAVGALGLLTSLSMSVFERQKEIGVMRSVGASSGAVTFQFLVEGIIIGVIAWAIGIPISYLLSKGLLQALNFGDIFEIGYPPETLLVGLVGTLIVVTIASLWPSLAAARKTVSDILRYQ